MSREDEISVASHQVTGSHCQSLEWGTWDLRGETGLFRSVMLPDTPVRLVEQFLVGVKLVVEQRMPELLLNRPLSLAGVLLPVREADLLHYVVDVTHDPLDDDVRVLAFGLIAYMCLSILVVDTYEPFLTSIRLSRVPDGSARLGLRPRTVGRPVRRVESRLDKLQDVPYATTDFRQKCRLNVSSSLIASSCGIQKVEPDPEHSARSS